MFYLNCFSLLFHGFSELAFLVISFCEFKLLVRSFDFAVFENPIESDSRQKNNIDEEKTSESNGAIKPGNGSLELHNNPGV